MSSKKPLLVTLAVTALCAIGSLCIANQSTSRAEQLYWEAVELHGKGKLAEALAKMKSAVNFASTNKSFRDYRKELEAAVAVSTFDCHALTAPPEAEKSVDELAKYLTKPAKNDREKVRLIFRWITDRISYDTKSFFSDTPTETGAEGVLRTRISVCEGYANLFDALCTAVGVYEVKISGYAKGFGYRSGDKFGEDTDHSWNAVKLDGQWLMIDATWGAGYTDGETKTFEKKLKEFYYLTPPEILLFSHLPKDPQYQFVKTPITKEQFEQWPEVNYTLFTVGFKQEAIRAVLDKQMANSGFLEVIDRPAVRTKVLEAPLTSTLHADKKVVIRIEAPGAIIVKAISNKDYKDPIEMELKKFGVYEATLMPKKGELLISGKLPGKGENFWTILRYKVE